MNQIYAFIKILINFHNRSHSLGYLWLYDIYDCMLLHNKKWMDSPFITNLKIFCLLWRNTQIWLFATCFCFRNDWITGFLSFSQAGMIHWCVWVARFSKIYCLIIHCIRSQIVFSILSLYSIQARKLNCRYPHKYNL